MTWFVLVLFAAGLLAAMFYALRRYEREGSAAALDEAAALREEMRALRSRVEHLEAIAAETPPAVKLPPEAAPTASTTPPAAVSSARRDPPV